MSRTSGRIVAGTVALLLVLAACGGGDSGSDGSDGGDGIRPAAGGFGGRLQPDATFSVVLMVLEPASPQIDFVGVACAPEGTIASGAITVQEDVQISDGSFSAKSTEVEISGEFVSETKAEGTARALTPDAEGCGIGAEGNWVSDCDLEVTQEEQENTGGLVIGGSSGTTDGGTAFSLVEVVTEDDKRLSGELIQSGSC